MRGKIVRVIFIGFSCLMLAGLFSVSFLRTDFKMEILDNLVFEGITKDEAVALSLWHDDTNGKYYLFVPSWFYEKAGEYAVRYPQGSGVVLIDGEIYHDGDIWKESGTEQLHEVEIRALFEEDKEGIKFSVQVLASRNLPALFIAVENKDGVISAVEFDNKQYLEAGYLELWDAEGKVLCRSELDWFKVRGNLTATHEKKPFTFSLKEPKGILGMESAVKWNLLSNSTDGTYVRNKIIRDLAYECINNYEPQGEFVDLYLNGEYQGMYLLTETVEMAENRIDISAEDNWLVEMELVERVEKEPTRIVTERGQNFVVHSERGIIERDLADIEKRLNDIESALYEKDGISKISGKSLEELIDLESFAEAWLIQELSGDHDTGIASQFLYASKENDAIWYAGPVWDFDGTMGNVNTPLYGVPEALTTSIAVTRPEGNLNINRWLSAMWNHSGFRQLVEEKYRTVFRDKYEEIYMVRIDEYMDTIRRSSVLDSFRWHKNRLAWWFTRPAEYSDPIFEDYTSFDTLDMFTDMVRDFMERKIVFLDKLWVENKKFYVVEIRNDAEFLEQWNNQTLYYWVEENAAIQNMPQYEAKGYVFEGYYDIETGKRVGNGGIIVNNCILEGKWTKGEIE